MTPLTGSLIPTAPEWQAYLQKYPIAKQVFTEAANADVIFLHVNDHYEVEPVDNGNKGGFARTAALANQFPKGKSRRTSAMDAFGSGSLVPIYKGSEMAAALKIYGLQDLTAGNHDFDHGDIIARERFRAVGGTVYLANLLKPDSTPLVEGKKYGIVEVGGRKIGIMGIVEDWSKELEPRKLGEHQLLDPAATAKTAADALIQGGAEMVVALTHCYEPTDRAVAKAANPDLILGGHFHEAQHLRLGATTLLKSGSDFENLGVVLVNFVKGERPRIRAYNLPITPELPDDPEMAEYVAGIVAETAHLRVPIAELGLELDGRKEIVRTEESNLGNLVADMFRKTAGADIGLMNGSGLRSEKIHPKGPITSLNVYDILSFDNNIVGLEISGADLLTAFEGGLDHHDDFPQVSGIRFEYDPEAPSGSRILRESIRIGGEAFDPAKIYKVACPSFISEGQCGYVTFKGAQHYFGDTQKIMMRDGLIAYLKEKKTVAVKADGRVKAVSSSTEARKEGHSG